MDVQTQASEELLKVLAYARDEAMRTGNPVIGTDHLFLGILRDEDNDVSGTLRNLGVDTASLKKAIEERLFRPKEVAYADRDRLEFSRNAQNVLNLSIIEASMAGADKIFPTHLLLAIMDTSSNVGVSLLKGQGVDRSKIAHYMKDNGLLSPHKVNADEGMPQRSVNILRIISSPDKIAS